MKRYFMIVLMAAAVFLVACGDEKDAVDPCAQERCQDSVVWCYDGSGEANYPVEKCPCGCSAGLCIDCNSSDYQGECSAHTSCRSCTTAMQCGWCGSIEECLRGGDMGSNNRDCTGTNWRWTLSDCYPSGCYNTCEGRDCGVVGDCDCGRCAASAQCISGRCLSSEAKTQD